MLEALVLLASLVEDPDEESQQGPRDECENIARNGSEELNQAYLLGSGHTTMICQ